MNQQTETVRLRHEELDREIETIRTERRIQAAGPPRPALASRLRTGLGRGLISAGTALVGRTDASASAPRRAGEPA